MINTYLDQRISVVQYDDGGWGKEGGMSAIFSGAIFPIKRQPANGRTCCCPERDNSNTIQLMRQNQTKNPDLDFLRVSTSALSNNQQLEKEDESRDFAHLA